MRYPVTIEKIEGDYIGTITHPKGRFQGVCAGGTKAEVVAQLRDLIGAVIASAMRDGDDIPLPEQCQKGNAWAMVESMVAAKALLYTQMRHSGKRKADIARALHVNQRQVDRIFDPAHRSTLTQLDAAAAAMGMSFDIRLA